MTVALASATLVARLLAFQAAETANAKIEGIQPASAPEQVARLGQDLTNTHRCGTCWEYGWLYAGVDCAYNFRFSGQLPHGEDLAGLPRTSIPRLALSEARSTGRRTNCCQSQSRRQQTERLVTNGWIASGRQSMMMASITSPWSETGGPTCAVPVRLPRVHGVRRHRW